MSDHDLVPKGDDDDDGLLAHPGDTASTTPDLPEVADPDESPGEQLDTGQDIGNAEPAPNQETEHPIDAPVAAIADPGPDPITPASSQEQYDARVKYESEVNAQFDRWIEVNRAAILDAFLAGQTVELNIGKDDVDTVSGGELDLPVDDEHTTPGPYDGSSADLTDPEAR